MVQHLRIKNSGQTRVKKSRWRNSSYEISQVLSLDNDPCENQFEFMWPERQIGQLGECNVLKNIRHANICRFKSYDNGTSKIKEYCVFCLSIAKKVIGFGSVSYESKWVASNVCLMQTRIKKFIIEILFAVDYLHEREIIHRDLKPRNIFVKGKDYAIQIDDLGIACRSGSGTTMVEDVGTLLYQNLEIVDDLSSQGAEGYDCETDILSLGCLIL